MSMSRICPCLGLVVANVKKATDFLCSDISLSVLKGQVTLKNFVCW